MNKLDRNALYDLAALEAENLALSAVTTSTRDKGTATRNEGTSTRDKGTATRNEDTSTRDEGYATRNEDTSMRSEERAPTVCRQPRVPITSIRQYGSALLTGLVLLMLATLAVVTAVSMSKLSTQHQALRSQRDSYRAEAEEFFDLAQQRVFNQGLVSFIGGRCHGGECFLGDWLDRESNTSCKRHRNQFFQPEVPYLSEEGSFNTNWMTLTAHKDGSQVYTGIEFLCFLNLDGTMRPYLRANFVVARAAQANHQAQQENVFIMQEGWLLYGVW
ncbi:hypothetical protein [Umboniibacter marinipuniceus]|uniref:Uncharacterized protein n=1 Tax=Umboniibacter marinipuniceus TaxID=569599 RepID=A0A3M0A1U4_9GAMM|nr:hypothetical protein [Umboniibacter marinipuniceus]RMA78394.1 hypothetical protein DFR27_2325 [Umboniibacter marinipuniceus]